MFNHIRLKPTPNLLNMLSWYREVFIYVFERSRFFHKTQFALPRYTATNNRFFRWNVTF